MKVLFRATTKMAVALCAAALVLGGTVCAQEPAAMPTAAVRVWTGDVAADENAKSAAGTLRPVIIVGARNGSFSGEVVVDSAEAIKGLRASAGVLVDEVVVEPLELVGEVEDVEGDADLLGDTAGVGSVGRAATGARLNGGIGVGGGGDAAAHEEADGLVALAFEEQSGDAGIDSAAHGDDDFGSHTAHYSGDARAGPHRPGAPLGNATRGAPSRALAFGGVELLVSC